MKITERVDKHTHVPEEKLSPNPPFPDAIKIEITARCNLNCSYCATKKKLRAVGDMDKDFLYRILKQAKEVGVKEIGLFLLGEPFLVKALPEYIRYAKEEVGIEYVFLTSNGVLCTPKRLASVMEAGLDSLKISINAGTRERYKELHGVDCFDKVMTNLEWLHKHKSPSLHTCVSAIFIEQFEEELEQLKQFVLQYVDEFYYLPLYNQAGHTGGQFPTKIIGNPGRYENMVSPIPCWGLFNSAKISWDGWLTACYFDHDSRFEIADLNTFTLLEAWNHPKFVELRKQHLTGDLNDSLCASCLGLKSEV